MKEVFIVNEVPIMMHWMQAAIKNETKKEKKRLKLSTYKA
jgi:hypothetical protein